MSEVSMRALEWLKDLDPEVQAALLQPSYEEKVQQQRTDEENAATRRLASAYSNAEASGAKIHILSQAIALD